MFYSVSLSGHPADTRATVPAVTGRRAPSYRERILWELAERYDEFVDPLSGPSGIPGSGERVLRMPRSYTRSIVEFERLLKLCRDENRGAWWHLVEWWIKPPRVIRYVPVTVRKHGRLVMLKHEDGSPVVRPEVSVRRVAGVSEVRAREAVAWMADRWGLGHEPMLPQDEKRAA